MSKTIKYLKNNKVHKLVISPAFARIHAHLCGDGCLFTSKSRRSEKELLVHPRKNLIRNNWYTYYTNTNDFLVKQYISDVKKVLKRKVVKTHKFGYEIQNKWVYTLFKKLGVLKSHDWYIPKEILNSSLNIKKEWLKAFFDDEAHVSSSNIIINLVNYKVLKQIQKMLKEFNIKSNLNGPYHWRQFTSYHLIILKESLVIYNSKIGFYHPKKKKQLSTLIKNMGTQGHSP
jgi:hypothetical protein